MKIRSTVATSYELSQNRQEEVIFAPLHLCIIHYYSLHYHYSKMDRAMVAFNVSSLMFFQYIIGLVNSTFQRHVHGMTVWHEWMT